MSVLFEKRAAVLKHEAATKRLNAEIELQRLKLQMQEIENIRVWAFADDGPAEEEWQKGYDSAKAMVRALLPANAI
jgi:hypothetical protein